MKIFLVAGGNPSWWGSGWGHALVSGVAERSLVSFVEYSKDARPTMQITGMAFPYQPKRAEDERRTFQP